MVVQTNPTQGAMLKLSAIVLVVCALAGVQAQAQARGEPEAASHVDLEDAHLDVPELIVKYGYPVEVHDVTTSDGYILQMHRIPHGRNNEDASIDRPVAFVMHGLLSSSADYIIMGPERGLGYILADEGFDVWLGNARGNYYSRRHTRENPERAGFWNFSWDEIGSIDVAALIDYIIEVTGRDSVHYIGHSQGTTTFFVLAALKPEYNAKIKTAQLMAPVAYLNNFDSPALANLANYANTLMNVGSVVGLHEIFPRGETFEYVDGEPRCIESNPLSSFCEQFIPAFASQSLDQFDKEMLPVIFGHTPAGSSLKQFAHYGQVLSSERFRRWSFQLPLQNLLAYGSLAAPLYSVSSITARVKLHYSLADTLTPEADVIALNSALPNSELRPVSLETFTHFDFAWGTEARDHVYNDLIESMHSFERGL